MTHFTNNPQAPEAGFQIQLTSSARNKPKPLLVDPKGVPYLVNLYCPESVLKAFQDLIKDSLLCGTAFYNPFTEQLEKFPDKPEDFTARHLQLLARNEDSNVSGRMALHLYAGLLTEDQIARIRCLVKFTVTVGQVEATHKYGYKRKKQAFDQPEPVLVIDQAGYQWQDDLRNTGGLFFYPQDPNSAALPEGYGQWQEELYAQVLRKPRPAQTALQHTLTLQWASPKPVKGVLDLDGFKEGIKVEFKDAFSALIDYSKNLPEDSKPVHFKFLKAGMGFFCEGLQGLNHMTFIAAQADELAQIELARLKGILEVLSEYPADVDWGKVKALSLPWSVCPQNASPALTTEFAALFVQIEQQCKRLDLDWGGVEKKDSLEPVPGYLTALTNCADPHALIGNEGGYSSVDAAIGSNIPDIHRLNATYNTQIHCCTLSHELNVKTTIQNNTSPLTELDLPTQTPTTTTPTLVATTDVTAAESELDARLKTKQLNQLIRLCKRYKEHLKGSLNNDPTHLADKKEAIVSSMLSALTNEAINDSNIKIQNMEQILTSENKETLKAHRHTSADFKFLEAVLNILSFGIYSKIDRGTFAFWKSHGEVVIDEMDELKNLTKKNT